MKRKTMICNETNRIDSLNMSDIWDKLIRFAAHYTDRFASDLMIDYTVVMEYINNLKNEFINDLTNGSKNNSTNGNKNDLTNKSFIFGMRRSGVDHAEYVFCSQKEIDRYGKIFQLDFIPQKNYEHYVKVELWEIEYTYGEQYKNDLCTYAPIE